MLPPEKFKCKLLTPSRMQMAKDIQWMDKCNTICPFHHSSNGEGIKIIEQFKFSDIYCYHNIIAACKIQEIFFLYFWTKTYLVHIQWNCLGNVIPIRTPKMCFGAKITRRDAI